MKRLLIGIYSAELMLALRLGTFGDYWAARAARRLGKISGKLSN